MKTRIRMKKSAQSITSWRRGDEIYPNLAKLYSMRKRAKAERVSDRTIMLSTPDIGMSWRNYSGVRQFFLFDVKRNTLLSSIHYSGVAPIFIVEDVDYGTKMVTFRTRLLAPIEGDDNMSVFSLDLDDVDELLPEAFEYDDIREFL